MFPKHAIWSNEGGNCDQEWVLARIAADPDADLRECHRTEILAPSALAQAGYLVGVSSYLRPKAYTADECAKVNTMLTACTLPPSDRVNCPCPEGKTCPALTELPESSIDRKFEKLFWYRPADGGRGLFGLGEKASETATLTLRPVYHAISPATAQPILFNEDIKFRTGLNRECLAPMARFQTYLKNGQTVGVNARAAGSFDEAPNPNLGFEICVLNSPSCPSGCLRTILASDPEKPAQVQGSFHNELGDGTYTFFVLPNKFPPYVPTEEETPLRNADGSIVPQVDKGGNIIRDTSGNPVPQTLRLNLWNNIAPDNELDPPHVQAQVLQAAEGAYVEGVIRFELASSPMPVASRRPRGP